MQLERLDILHAQNDETPVGNAFRGLSERSVAVLPNTQPRNT
jgi:hypothetical protein